MTEIDRIATEIEAKAAEVGLKELARRADVPYTTAVEFRKHGWKPRSVVTLAKLAAAANDVDRQAA